MSRSKLRSRWMRKVWDASDQRNPHKYDEKPKNHPSRYIRVAFDSVSWMQESGSFGGHEVKHQGHRMVSGITRQKVREQVRRQIDDELSL